MAQPRPSATLILDIDESQDSEEVRLEVGRCYTHVAPTLVRTHAAQETPENICKLLVKLGTKKYLHSSDEGADDLWNTVMERWFLNMFHKVGNNMKIYNRRQNEVNGTPLFFDWIEVDLQNGELPVRLHLDSNSDIDFNNNVWLSAVRTALNEGLLGEDVASVSLPSPASYAEQRVAGLAAKAEREAELTRAAEEAAEEARRQKEEAEKAAEEAFLESPELAAEESETPIGEGSEDIEALYAFPEPDFVIDYSVWSVTFADGSCRTFDSNAQAFVD